MPNTLLDRPSFISVFYDELEFPRNHQQESDMTEIL